MQVDQGLVRLFVSPEGGSQQEGATTSGLSQDVFMYDSNTKDYTSVQPSESAQDVDMSKTTEQTSAPSAGSTQERAAEDQDTTPARDLSPDKRDREPPDTIAKPEGKMPKTTEESAEGQVGDSSQEGTSASASASSVDYGGGYQSRRDPTTGNRIIDCKSVAIAISAEFYNSLLEWKMKICLELMSQCPPDRAEIATWSGLYFATPELLGICASEVATLAGGALEVTSPTRTAQRVYGACF